MFREFNKNSRNIIIILLFFRKESNSDIQTKIHKKVAVIFGSAIQTTGI